MIDIGVAPHRADLLRRGLANRSVAEIAFVVGDPLLQPAMGLDDEFRHESLRTSNLRCPLVPPERGRSASEATREGVAGIAAHPPSEALPESPMHAASRSRARCDRMLAARSASCS